MGYTGYEVVLQYVPWLAVPAIALVVLLIVRKMVRRSVNRNVRAQGIMSGMSMMDLDQMRRQGQLSDEEYKRVRQTLARKELERSRQRAQSGDPRDILAQIELNPDSARQFITPEPDPVATKPPAPAPPEEAADDLVLEFPTAAPPQAARPKPASAPRPAQANPPRDIDILLKKGIISREEYDRLRKFVE